MAKAKKLAFADLFVVLALCLCALLLGTRATRSPVAAASSSVKVTNLRDTAFTVSWLTDDVVTGTVEYGTAPALGSVAEDDRGTATSDDTHHVTLSGLVPGTTYYFDVLSGDQRDDNNGAHYAVATGSVLELPTSDTVYGRVFQCDGITPAQGAIVYVTLADGDGTGSLGQSAQMSGLVDENGWWHANLGNARVGGLSAYFYYSASGDQLVLEAQGAGDGVGDLAMDTGDDAPASDLIICPATNTPPTLSWLPDQVFDQSTSPPGTTDLWAYAWDAESATSALTYTVEGPPPAGAGVWLEGNRTVHTEPSPNWCGGTDVTVRATDPGGLWDEDTFRVAVSWSCPGPVEMPGAPVLIAPVDGRAAQGDAPTFAWHEVGGAEAYQIQVDDEADKKHPAGFSSPEGDEVVASTDYTPAAGLSGGVYTWRVRAVNGSEIGAWSPEWTFAVPTLSPPGFKLYLPVVAREYP